MKVDIDQLLPRKRHKEVFDWLCSVMNKKPEDLIREIVTQAVVKEYPSYRESLGGGGNSSKNLSSLSERIAPIK